MVKGCGNKCMKYCLFAFNLIFLLVGLALLICGIFVLIKAKDFADIIETPDVANAASILVIIVGLSISIIAFFGCCGAIQEGRCMLVTYALVVSVAMLLEIAAAALLLVYNGQITDNVTTGMENAIRKYRPNDVRDGVTALVDNVQWTLQCCGARDILDWQKTHPGVYSSNLPNSCCFDPREGGRGICGVQNAFRKPCAPQLETVLRFLVWFMAGSVIVAVLIQLVAACFACSVAKAA